MFIIYVVFWCPMPWYESTSSAWYGLPFHEPVTHYLTFLVLSIIGFVGYIILRVRKKPLPPLVTVLCMSAMLMGCILSLLFILQLTPHITEAYSFFFVEGFLICLLPLNFIICSIRVTRRIIMEAELNNQRIYKSRFMQWCNRMLDKGRSYPIAAFVLMIPLLALIMLVLTFFGQKPDAFITTFTDTSDWLLSAKTAPAVEYYGCEYLCTAAAQGHSRVVKPLRTGLRGGRRIVINHQLCVANAFEELLQEKMPLFRRLLRRVYDAIGCPLARRIHTPIAADVAYIVIKPLEWIMVLILYLVEAKPENRIARQYLPIK